MSDIVPYTSISGANISNTNQIPGNSPPAPAASPQPYTPDAPTDRIGGVSQNPNVPNADGTAYKAPMRYTGSGAPQPGPAPENDPALHANELAGVQNELDSINKNFATNLQTVTTQNQNLIGGTRARDARTGLLGSDFGAANEAGATDKANANTAKLTAAHDKEVNTIYQGIQKDISAKQTAYQNQQNKLTDQQNKDLRDNAIKAVDGLAAKGTSLDTLTQDEYNHIIESTGMTDAQLQAYYAGKVPADKILKEQIQNGNLIQVFRDPTGKVSVHTMPLNINIPPDYTTTHLPSGQIAFIPKGTAPDGVLYSSKVTPDTDTKGKMIIYDGPGGTKPVTAKSRGGLTPTQQNKDKETKAQEQDLKDAQAAISNGADPAKVRQRFIETHISGRSAYDKFMNPPNKSKNPYPSTKTSSGGGA